MTHDAEDLVQEAYLRAFKSFDGFRGGDGRALDAERLSAIPATPGYNKTATRNSRRSFDEEVHTVEESLPSPETVLLQSADAQLLRDALEKLPVEFREILVLRELEGMSYREIADLAGIPVGTVMSRLARGRERLQRQLTHPVKKEP